ncbi:MAG TPA: DUF4345 family protein [Polyangiaceae bacterium]|nr:DUF4345 family protein [Polyangiaceae bacterium]
MAILQNLRRLVLAGSGLTFGTIAIAAVVWPRTVAVQYGLHLDGVDAFNEFRAVFVGFWLALATSMIVAARRPALSTLGDLCGIALVLQAMGRLPSVAVDGRPSVPFLGAMVGEALAGAVVLLGRVRGGTTTSPTGPAVG